MSDLQTIVQRMIDAGEPEENIKLVIENYNKQGKQEDSSTETPTAESNVTGSGSESGSSGLPVIEFDPPESTVIENPQSGEDIERSINAINNNTTFEKDSRLRKTVLNEFFNYDEKEAVPDMPYQYPAGSTSYHPEFNPLVSDNTSTLGMTSMQPVIEDINRRDQERRDEYLLETWGEEKFNLYKKYLDNNLDIDIQEVKNLEKAYEGEGANPYTNILASIHQLEKKHKPEAVTFNTQDYVGNNKNLIDKGFVSAIEIDEDVQEYYSGDFLDDYASIQEKAEAYAVDATPGSGGVSEMGYVTDLSEKGKVETKKAIAKEAVELQYKYLENSRNVLNGDIENYKKYIESLNIPNNDLSAYLDDESIDIEQRRKVLNQTNELQNRIKIQHQKAVKFNNMTVALEALDKSYSFGYRIGLAFEDAILGDMGLFVKGGAALIADQVSPESVVSDYLKESYVSHIDYAESVKQKKQAQLPVDIKLADVDSGNWGDFLSQVVGNNSFSVGTALTYAGIAKKLTSKPLQKYAKRALQGTFFTAEGGAKLSEMEIMQKNAAETIEYLENILEQDDAIPETRTGIPEDGKIRLKMSEDQRLEIQKEIERNKRALNYTQTERAFMSLTYGGIATAAETLGTMRVIDDLFQTSKITGGVSFRNAIKGTKNYVLKPMGTEVLEESATLLGHNFMDIMVLKDDKSLIEGLDPDFVANVAISSLAIGGPNVSRAVRNSLRSTLQTKEQREKFRELTAEFIELDYILKEGFNVSADGGRLSKKDADLLKKRRLEILNEAGVTDVANFMEATNLEDADIVNLFENQRKRLQIFRQAQELGAVSANNDAIKRERQKLLDEYKELNDEKEAILAKPKQQRDRKLQKTAKDNNIEDTRAVDASIDYGRAAYYDGLVKGLGGKIVKFDNDNSEQDLAELKKYLDEAIKSGKLKDKKLEDGTVITAEEQKQSIIEGATTTTNALGVPTKIGGSATFVGDDILTFENNRRLNILLGNDVQRADATQASVHELQHQYDMTKGLVKDGKVVKSHSRIVNGLQRYVKDQYDQGVIDKKTYKQFRRRVDQYRNKVNKNKVADQSELLTLIGTMKRAGMLKSENTSVLYELKSMINKVRGLVHGENSTLLDMNTTKDVLRYIDTFNKRVDAGKVKIQLPEDEVSKQAKGVDLLSDINSLIPENVQTNEQYNDFLNDERNFMALYKAMQENGVISNYVKSRTTSRAEYAEAIDSIVMRLRNFKPDAIREKGPKKGERVGREGFGEFIFANTRFGKMDAKKALAQKAEEAKRTESIDTPEARQLTTEDDTQTTSTQDTKKPKIDILKFTGLDKVVGKIRDLVKPVKGDTFKEIISKYVGDVGQLIFDIPAKKIMEGGANLIPTTKIKEGMAVPSEALNIQRFFANGQNLDKFIRTLPLYNVTDMTADINRQGENIDVSRDTYGVAIGLKGLPLNYFYEDYVDPTGKMTSPKGRSKGLTSQTPVKRLKAEFRNPTPETVEKVRADIGITPTGQKNNYNRDIGQLLKGFAKVYSINAALSAAQRAQEAKLETAKPEDVKAIKQQTADITAAQSKAAFSKGVEVAFGDVDNILLVDQLDLDGKRLDQVLEMNGEKPTYDLSMALDINKQDDLIEIFKNDLFPTMPRDFFFTIDENGNVTNDVFTYSHKNYGNFSMSETSKGSGVYKNPKEREAYNRFRNKIRELGETLSDSDFAKPIPKANFNVTKSYETMFGTHEKLKNQKEIEQWNKDVSFIHSKMYESFNNAIAKDKSGKAARVIGTYLKLTANDKMSWHRLGAQLIGYSKEFTIGKTEMEHAMPATAAYLYLMNSMLDERVNFPIAYERVMENYKLIVLDKAMDNKLTKARTKSGKSLRSRMPDGWSVIDGSFWQRYFNADVVNTDGVGIDPNSIVGLDGKTTFGKMFNINAEGLSTGMQTGINKDQKMAKAINKARAVNRYTKQSRGMSAFDFDETLIDKGQNTIIATKGNDVVEISSGNWPLEGPRYAAEGYTFDFSDFINVKGGVAGPLLQKLKNRIKKYGAKNNYILTARPAEAAPAIHAWLKTQGINLPLENITGLGNSTGEAKAMWIADKYSQGYNDIYFVDDALPNVEAVADVIDQLDIKGKSVQAKAKFSKGMDVDFNKILEDVTGIDAAKRFSDMKAKKRGETKGKFRFFIPPSHEDFVGLLYNFMGKGEQGNQHRDFFEKALVRPLNRAYQELNVARQSIANDYKELNKRFDDIKKKLGKKLPSGDFTFEDAVRVYIWNKHGYEVPGLSQSDLQELTSIVNSDSRLKVYADSINAISKQEKYVNPTETWDAGDIRQDLDDATGRVGRAEFFEEFFENADIIFSKENLNKIEAAYGAEVVEAIKDILYRTKTGKNRPSGSNALVNKFLNYLNGSVASTMFFNIRSAVLQQMSMVNFINFADNNILAAAKAFANQDQYWKDWAYIFNSDFMKQRRGGIMTDVNGAELAASVRNAKNPAQAVIKKLLQIGFLPTQIGDNIAIATGGASFFRNRVNTYLKQGLSQKQAEERAWTDFVILAESTQQSARPDMVSQQQASPLGKVILAFQNVTSQFNRLGKKAFLDIKNRRITPGNTTQLQSDLSNLSRIAYYFVIQNLVFYALQSALFAVMFDDDEDDEQFLKKKERMISGSIDSVLRGAGVWGAAVATLKNMAIKWHEQRDKGYNKDESAVLMEMLNVSPPLGIKARKIVNAEKTLNYNKKVIDEMSTFDIDNPMWSATTSYIEAITNVPLNRLYNKTVNVRDALDSQHTAMQRALMFGGWSKWNLGLKNEKIEQIKEDIKEKKKKKKKSYGEPDFKNQRSRRKEPSTPAPRRRDVRKRRNR